MVDNPDQTNIPQSSNDGTVEAESTNSDSGSPRWRRMAAMGLSLWRRWALWGWARGQLGRIIAAIVQTWQRLGAFDRVRIMAQLVVVFLLLAVLPWHGSNFDVRRFINGLFVMKRGARCC